MNRSSSSHSLSRKGPDSAGAKTVSFVLVLSPPSAFLCYHMCLWHLACPPSYNKNSHSCHSLCPWRWHLYLPWWGMREMGIIQKCQTFSRWRSACSCVREEKRVPAGYIVTLMHSLSTFESSWEGACTPPHLFTLDEIKNKEKEMFYLLLLLFIQLFHSILLSLTD